MRMCFRNQGREQVGKGAVRSERLTGREARLSGGPYSLTPWPMASSLFLYRDLPAFSKLQATNKRLK